LFSITHGFALSKLLFSPDASFSSRNILISKEVRYGDDYIRCIRPYKDLTWSNALLKFVIVDIGSTPRVWSLGECAMGKIEFLLTMSQIQEPHRSIPQFLLVNPLLRSLRPLFMPWRLTNPLPVQLLHSIPRFHCSTSPPCPLTLPVAQ